LVRYVLSPQGNIVVDYRKKLPGRGVYTCPDFQCLQTAIKKGQLVRGLRGGDNPDAAQLWQDLHDQVRIKALNLLGMARKAGQILSGTRQVLCELQAGRDIALLIRAADLSSSIAAKVEGAALRNEVPLFVFSGKEQMGQLLGKSERGVVALKNGSLAVAIRNELERLQKFAGEFNG
jgi:ribosomal protein L7Ae-like RNA K-turn-binding protein